MYLVKGQKSCSKIYILHHKNDNFIQRIGIFLQNSIKKITGASLELVNYNEYIANNRGIVLSLFDNEYIINNFADENKRCKDDGFAIYKRENSIFILSHVERGLLYGVVDFLENNAGCIFARGAEEEFFQYIPSNFLRISHVDYVSNPAFKIRSWNLCGTGSENKQHHDKKTAECMILNGVNGTCTLNDETWSNNKVSGTNIALEELQNFDDLMDEHPEFFMTDFDGKPKKAMYGEDSFLNYYNKDLAKVFAERLVSLVKENEKIDKLFWRMPDNPYFNMVKNGKKLQELPFTADDGTTVYPEDNAYKSTVYYNFLNRVMREANSIRPNTYLGVFAYIYSEPIPPIKIDKHLIIYIAPIHTNEKHSYQDLSNSDNDKIRDNIFAWSKKASKVAIYTYWQCFMGEIYSRPIVHNVKENLMWFKKSGIYQLVNEGRVDCTISKVKNSEQEKSVKFYDMNEIYIWIINHLMWNPNFSIEELTLRFCKIVYKECFSEMWRYFSLIKIGWDKKDTLVWYTTGGDVYYLQFVINAGIAKDVMNVLKKARSKAVTPSVVRKINSIYETVESEIKKYSKFKKENVEIVYCNGEDILSEKALDYINNDKSIWNKAKSLKVLKDYQTMENYAKEAQFSCKMLYDEKNIYVAYTIFDDEIKRVQRDGNNIRVFREDGTEVESYAETYIGGNITNKSTYYGYISGYFSGGSEGQFYQNSGSPKLIKIPDGLKDVKFVHLDENKAKRYMVHVQKIPFNAIDTDKNDASPYGSFVYYTNRYGRAGWMGFGLWSKENFQPFMLKKSLNKEEQ